MHQSKATYAPIFKVGQILKDIQIGDFNRRCLCLNKQLRHGKMHHMIWAKLMRVNLDWVVSHEQACWHQEWPLWLSLNNPSTKTGRSSATKEPSIEPQKDWLKWMTTANKLKCLQIKKPSRDIHMSITEMKTQSIKVLLELHSNTVKMLKKFQVCMISWQTKTQRNKRSFEESKERETWKRIRISLCRSWESFKGTISLGAQR